MTKNLAPWSQSPQRNEPEFGGSGTRITRIPANGKGFRQEETSFFLPGYLFLSSSFNSRSLALFAGKIRLWVQRKLPPLLPQQFHQPPNHRLALRLRKTLSMTSPVSNRNRIRVASLLWPLLLFCSICATKAQDFVWPVQNPVVTQQYGERDSLRKEDPDPKKALSQNYKSGCSTHTCLLYTSDAADE